jgi:hypothetical protein
MEFVSAFVGNAAVGCPPGLVRDEVKRVEWIEETVRPLVGCIPSQSSFLAHSYAMLGGALPPGTQLEIENVRVAYDYAVVTLRFLCMADGELELNCRYRWICRFAGAHIQESPT